jgi:uncharacterized protein YodC (DUF2158 family)
LTSEFKKGDVVRLKSGGPRMTVQDLGSFTGIEDGVVCVWFENNKQQSAVFDRAGLEHAGETKPLFEVF